MRLEAIAFTDQGMKLGNQLHECKEFDMTLTRCCEGMLKEWTSLNFNRADALLFLGSIGIAVRAIAPFLQSKGKDPAVVVMDELGNHVIPILSGHIGGANKLALILSGYTGARSVITTATDLNGCFAVDAWAIAQGLIITNPERIKVIASKLLMNRTIKIKSSYPISGNPPRGVVLSDQDYDVLISHQKSGMTDVLHLIPPVVTMGIGSKKGVAVGLIEAALEFVLQKANCHALAISKVCSIEIKAKEAGILEFCGRRDLPYETFSALELARVEGEFHTSAFVESITGIDNVCERAAVFGSGGRLLSRKEACNGVTIALAIHEPKLCFEEEG